MNKFLIVFKREYLASIKNRFFWIATLIVPIIILLITFTPIIISLFDTKPTVRILLVNSERYLKADELNKFNRDNIEFTFSTNAIENPQNLLKDSDNLDALIDFNTINPSENNYDIVVLSKEVLGFSQETMLTEFIVQLMQDIRIKQEKIPTDQALRLNQPIYPKFTTVESETASSFTAFFIAYGAVFLMYFLIIFYSSRIITSIQEEKKNRVVEILLSSMNTSELLFGKIFGTLAIGATQILLWLIISIISLPISGILISPLMTNIETTNNLGDNTNNLIWEQIQILNKDFNILFIFIMFLVFLFFGLLLYLGIFACIAAITDSEADAQNLSVLGFAPIIISLLSISTTIDNPSSNITTILSIIPFTSPINMLARIPFNVPIWELLISLLLLILTSIITILFASKIYKIGILLYGEKLSWKHIKTIFIK
jgi:ABC-2 type transport system permease protein